MPTLVQGLSLTSNPFEHYTAETEPHIAEYAVKPPYLTTISARARATSSFILFGDRGAGKSATRITLFRDLWAAKGKESETGIGVPLAVNYIDFSKAIKRFKSGSFSESDIIAEVAFLTIETTLAWLSSLTDGERDIYTGALDNREKALVIALLKTFYFVRGEIERKQTERDALVLLNQAWVTRSAIWAAKRWDVLSTLIGRITEIATKQFTSGSVEVADRVELTLKSLVGLDGEVVKPVLQKLVDFVRIFGFTGVVILIDKVDETEFTQNSAESTTKLIHPLLSHVQLLEVDGFAWQLFLWSQVKPFMGAERYRVRLDKIASVTIDWDISFFRQMLDERIKFFSAGRISFSDILDETLDVDTVLGDLINTATKSPRELVRLMDIVFTEHDIRHSSREMVYLLDQLSLQMGQDRYVKERINSVYDEKILNQLYRLASLKFTNSDVQSKFRINSQSARNKIKSWEDAGVAKQTGTRAAEGDKGGKPSYEYSIVDSRIARIIRNKLVIVEDYETDENVEIVPPVTD